VCRQSQLRSIRIVVIVVVEVIHSNIRIDYRRCMISISLSIVATVIVIPLVCLVRYEIRTTGTC